MHRVLGFDEDEYRATYGDFKKFINMVHPADREAVINSNRRILTGEHTSDFFEIERRLLTKSGNYIWLLNRWV